MNYQLVPLDKLGMQGDRFEVMVSGQKYGKICFEENFLGGWVHSADNYTKVVATKEIAALNLIHEVNNKLEKV